MPAKGTTKLTPAQKAKIVAARLSGKSGKEMAAAAGVSRETAARWVNKPELQTLIARLKATHESDLQQIFAATVAGLKRDVKSAEPDVRHRAMSLGLKVVTAGDAPLARIEPASGGQGEMELEQILVLYRRATIGPG